MDSNTRANNEDMQSASAHLREQNSDSTSRPDWDPYAVWLTHIMKTPENASPSKTNTKAGSDSSWNPYAVWQALIKN